MFLGVGLTAQRERSSYSRGVWRTADLGAYCSSDGKNGYPVSGRNVLAAAGSGWVQAVTSGAPALASSFVALTSAARPSAETSFLIHSAAFAVFVSNKRAFQALRKHSDAIVREIRSARDEDDLHQALEVTITSDDAIRGFLALVEIGRSRAARLFGRLLAKLPTSQGRGLRPRARARVEAADRLLKAASKAVREASPDARSSFEGGELLPALDALDNESIRRLLRELAAPSVPVEISGLLGLILRGFVGFWVVQELAHVPVREVPLWLEERLAQAHEDGAYALLRLIASVPGIHVPESDVPPEDRLDLARLELKSREAREQIWHEVSAAGDG